MTDVACFTAPVLTKPCRFFHRLLYRT